MGRSTDEYLSTVDALLVQLQSEIDRAKRAEAGLLTTVRVVEEGGSHVEPIEVQEP